MHLCFPRIRADKILLDTARVFSAIRLEAGVKRGSDGSSLIGSFEMAERGGSQTKSIAARPRGDKSRLDITPVPGLDESREMTNIFGGNHSAYFQSLRGQNHVPVKPFVMGRREPFLPGFCPQLRRLEHYRSC